MLYDLDYEWDLTPTRFRRVALQKAGYRLHDRNDQVDAAEHEEHSRRER
jgi:hypothetical protein